MQASLRARLFSLSGRLNVPEAFFLQLLLGALASVLVYALGHGADWRREMEIKLIVDALVGVVTTFLLTKRLHDHGWSGWWALFAVPLIPLGVYRSWRVTLLNPEVLTGDDPWWYSPAFLISVPIFIAMLGVMFIPGSAIANRYGPSPRTAPDEPVHNA